jgi:hypothetical protein
MPDVRFSAFAARHSAASARRRQDFRSFQSMNDLKFAFRQLLKNPGFTAFAVTAFRPFYPAHKYRFETGQPGRNLSSAGMLPVGPGYFGLYNVPFKQGREFTAAEGQNWKIVSGGDFNDVNTQSRSFSHVAAFFGNTTFNLSRTDEFWDLPRRSLCWLDSCSERFPLGEPRKQR